MCFVVKRKSTTEEYYHIFNPINQILKGKEVRYIRVNKKIKKKSIPLITHRNLKTVFRNCLHPSKMTQIFLD